MCSIYSDGIVFDVYYKKKMMGKVKLIICGGGTSKYEIPPLY